MYFKRLLVGEGLGGDGTGCGYEAKVVRDGGVVD